METLRVLDSCDELIQFMQHDIMDYHLPIVIFQGDTLEVCRTGIQYPKCTVEDIFVSSREVNNCFFLQNVSGSLLMMTPTIMVPNYVKYELIATLKGEW